MQHSDTHELLLVGLSLRPGGHSLSRAAAGLAAVLRAIGRNYDESRPILLCGAVTARDPHSYAESARLKAVPSRVHS
jgi:hypothetical protein